MSNINRIGKIISAGILMMLFFSTISVVASPKNEKNEYLSNFNNQSTKSLDEYTHTVLVEACTATWCSPCATASTVMNQIFYSGDYNFYYTSLVSDKNGYANARCSELGVQYIPDYVFDGDYKRYVGSVGLPSAYTYRLKNCGSRYVEDIDLNLDINWKGNAAIDINLDIVNNEATYYNGHLHVYVTEIVSRWNTKSGQPYHFAMIGNYAFNENVNIAAGATSEHSTTWEGSSYGFSDLEEDNVMIIATVFNLDNNNYVDETTAASFIDLWPTDIGIEIKGGLSSVSAVIKNIGDYIIDGIDWKLDVNGGILDLIDVSSEGSISRLVVDDEKTLKTDKPVFGLGRITISVNVNIGYITKQALVLGPLVLVI